MMNVFFIGLVFWIVALLALACLFLRRPRRAPSVRAVLLALPLLAGVAFLLFRPHEDVLGGQDQGAYLNSAATFARRQALSYTDPLLADVSPEERPLFFYGYRYFPDTKYMCLWVRSIDGAVIAPWFQPAYPILMSVAATLGPVRAMLYVCPLFALLTGLALYALARRLFDHPWAGAAAFLLYTLNPLVVWHARSARAELIAGFYLLAGAALLLQAWDTRDRPAWSDVLLGSTCITLAPFFHVTAWYAVLPAALVTAIIVLRARPVFVLFPITAVAAGAIFAAQTNYITDCYNLSLVFDVAQRYALWSIVPALAGLAALGAAGFRLAERRGTAARPPDRQRPSPRLRAGAAWLAAALTTLCFWLAYSGRLAVPERWAEHGLLRNVQLTEFRSFVIAVSPPLAALGLLGWVLFIVRGGPRRERRLVFALAVFPALMLMGEMPILLYFVRRCLPYVVPGFTLGLTALVTLVPVRGRAWRKAVAAGLLAGTAALGGLQRPLLYQVVDQRGLLEFLEPFAREIRSRDGILLFEYSRLAAPFEHLFGIPTLPIDNERRRHYPPVMDAWEKVMRRNPDRPAYFITPYGPPVSDRFVFTPVLQATHRMKLLSTEPRRLPDEIRRPEITLSLYAMRLREPGDTSDRPDFPYVRTIDKGNMGLRHFSRGRERHWIVSGIPFTAGRRETLSIDPELAHYETRELLLFFWSTEPGPEPPVLEIEDGTAPAQTRWVHLVDSWWALRAALPRPGMPSRVTVTARSPMLLSSANAVTDTRSVAIPPGPEADGPFKRRPFVTYVRWAQSLAEIAVPLPPRDGGLVLIFAHASRPRHAERPKFLVYAGAEKPGCIRKLESRWTWHACPLRFGPDAEAVGWLRLLTVPPWDSGHRDLPRNLGVLVKHVVVLPPLE